MVFDTDEISFFPKKICRGQSDSINDVVSSSRSKLRLLFWTSRLSGPGKNIGPFNLGPA